MTIGSPKLSQCTSFSSYNTCIQKNLSEYEINIMEGSIKELGNMGIKGIVDLAITVLPLQLSNLKYTKLFDEKICIAVSPQNILAKNMILHA